MDDAEYSRLLTEAVTYNRAYFLTLPRRVFRDTATAEDVLSSAVESAWAKRSTFDPRRGAFCKWFQRIVQVRTYDALRRQESRNKLGMQHDFSDRGPGAVADRSLTHDSDQAEMVRKIVVGLSPEDRQMILRSYWHGISWLQISVEDGIKFGTFKSRMNRVLGKVRQRMLLNMILEETKLEEQAA